MKNVFKKIVSFFSELWEIRVGEGEMLRPFYKDVYLDWSSKQKVMAFIGVHWIHQFYIWLAYKAFRKKNLLLISFDDYNIVYENGKKDGINMMWKKIIEEYQLKVPKSAKKKKKLN